MAVGAGSAATRLAGLQLFLIVRSSSSGDLRCQAPAAFAQFKRLAVSGVGTFIDLPRTNAAHVMAPQLDRALVATRPLLAHPFRHLVA